MDLQTRKIAFVQKFLSLESEEFVSFLETMLQSETNGQLQPMTMQELNARIDTSLEYSENDNVIEATEILKEINEWH